MPSKPPSKVTLRRELPEVVPGTPAQLLEIARRVIGPPVRGRPRPDPARLQGVADHLGRLGRELLHGLQQQVTSPGAKAHEARLKQIQRHAQALEKAIAGLPPFAQDLLNHAYWAQRRWDPGARSFRDLGIGTAAAATAASAIAAAAEQQLSGWQKGVVVGRVPPEQRGPMGAYQRIIGDPRTFLAEQVAQLVIAEQGAKAATAEESGAVYAAVGELWEWATGLSDEQANLRKHIRLSVRDALLLARRGEVERAIEDEVTRYHAALTADMAAEVTPSPEARRAYNRRRHKLQAEQDRLTRKLLRSEPEQSGTGQGKLEQETPAQEKSRL